MNEQGIDLVAVTFNVAPALEERFIDWLLVREEVAGFTSYTVHGHGSDHDHLTVAEQVSGRRRRTEFRVELARAALDPLLAALSTDFAGVDLYYVVLPVLRSRHLSVPSRH